MLRLLKEMRYSLHVMVRPFSGYWDLKHEKRGSLASAAGLLLAYLLSVLAWNQFAGFFFVTNREREAVNILMEAIRILVPYVLWVVASWSFTSLMDGEGTIKEIAIATAYALAPMIVITLPLIPVSNWVSQEEIAFINVLRGVGVVWTAYLLFVGMIVTHQYTIPKTLGTIVLSIVGMCILIFLSMLVVSLLQQALSFFITVYREAQLRWL